MKTTFDEPTDRMLLAALHSGLLPEHVYEEAVEAEKTYLQRREQL